MRFATVILLVILFFFNQSDGQDIVPPTPEAHRPEDPPRTCPSSNSSLSDVWWTPLRFNDRFDPCRLLHRLSKWDNDLDRRGDHGGHHSSFTANSLQTYNIQSACKACTLSPVNTTVPSSGELGITQFPGSASNESNSLNGLPRWTNTSVGDDGRFNISQAVQVAKSDTQSSSGTRPDAGVIAGAVIGSFVFIAVVIIVFLLIRRRRLRVAPSAEFIAAAGPRATYNHHAPADETPPPFDSGQWRDPVIEKAYGSAVAQRRLDTGFSRV